MAAGATRAPLSGRWRPATRASGMSRIYLTSGVVRSTDWLSDAAPLGVCGVH
jgi:hypothetical protein